MIPDDIAALLDGTPDLVARQLIGRVERAERAEASGLALAALVGLGERLARYGLALDVLLRLGHRIGAHEAVDRGTASAYLCLRDTIAANRCLERLGRDPMENEAWALVDAAAAVGVNGDTDTASRWLVRAGALIRRSDDSHPAILAMARGVRRLTEGLLARPSSPAGALLPQAGALGRAWAERAGDRCEIACAEAALSAVCAASHDDIGALAHALAAHAMCTIGALPPEVGVVAAAALVRAHEAFGGSAAAAEARAWGCRQAEAVGSPRARVAALERLRAASG